MDTTEIGSLPEKAPPTQELPTLLRLPGEIRNLIYRELVETYEVIITYQRWNMYGICNENLRIFTIHQVNRQLHKEYCSFLYDRRMVEIRADESPYLTGGEGILSFLCRTPISFLATIKILRLPEHAIDDYFSDWYHETPGDFRFLREQTAKRLCQLPNLEQVICLMSSDYKPSRSMTLMMIRQVKGVFSGLKIEVILQLSVGGDVIARRTVDGVLEFYEPAKKLENFLLR
ncbi:unnamed protein product [Periconia digitata]|uniref:Uncharacterized protein n=1 Tax=Periconia digitata TaxID=1303443 RepID=A0A9W4XI22_9PLEO|nr:unnamed protein product [Periconia digitata]